jgi:hypothetical protein
LLEAKHQVPPYLRGSHVRSCPPYFSIARSGLSTKDKMHPNILFGFEVFTYKTPKDIHKMETGQNAEGKGDSAILPHRSWFR